MVAPPDDDAPALATTKGQVADPDDDSTGATHVKAPSFPSVVTETPGFDDPTVQHNVDPELVPKAIPARARPVAAPRPAFPAPMTSKRATAIGLPPPAPFRPAAPTPSPPRKRQSSHDEAGTGTETATSPALQSASVPLVAPGPVQIREVPVVDEPLDETEVRTLIAAPLPSSAARPPRRAPLLEQEDVVEDSVTTQAPYALAVRWLSEDDAERVSDSAVAAAPVANWTPSTARSAVDDVYEEERTTRGPRRNLEDLAVMAAAASEHPSITTEGPSTIADILRSTGSAPPNLASPEPIENQTAVMVNAPARPPSTHSGMAYGVSAEGGRPAADFMESSSGASMRVPVLRSDAGQGVNPGSDDLSLVTGRRAPRYGLMVALVALFSIAIPVALFVGLQDRANRRLGRAPSEPTSDVVSRDGVPRAKATRPAPSASPSATAVRPSWFPRRR